MRCPNCGGELKSVRYDPNSMLNREQFNSIKAGDYYCEKCKSEAARTGFRYFWKRDLERAGGTTE